MGHLYEDVRLSSVDRELVTLSLNEGNDVCGVAEVCTTSHLQRPFTSSLTDWCIGTPIEMLGASLLWAAVQGDA